MHLSLLLLSSLVLAVKGSDRLVAEYNPNGRFTDQSIIKLENPLRVPILLGVMSQCPDAIFCEEFFDSVLTRVGHDKVDIELSFLGRLNSSDKQYGVTCMHGPLECAGNIHQLCAQKYVSSQPTWWSFVQCLDHERREDIGREVFSIKCALKMGMDWRTLGDCVHNGEGLGLLKESVLKSQNLGISKSCSMFISGKLRCVHDSEWKDCSIGHKVSDFVNFIQEEYRRLNGIQEEDKGFDAPWLKAWKL